MNLTIIDPSHRFAGHEVRVNYGPFSLRETGKALGMKQPIPVTILGFGRPEELETVVEARDLLITDGPAWHCEQCGEVNPKQKICNEFTAEQPLTRCCEAFRCDGTAATEFAVGGPGTNLLAMDQTEIEALRRVVACCESHADRAAQVIDPNWRALGPVWERDPRDDEFDPYFGE